MIRSESSRVRARRARPLPAIVDVGPLAVRQHGGEPLAGDIEAMSALKPADHELVASPAGGYEKAVDSTAPVPEGGETLAQLTTEIEFGLTARGRDHPPSAGGPRPADQYLQLP